jgi:hypothetical protein
LENSISICLLVHSIFVLRIRIHLLHGVAEKTDCTTHLFFFVPVRAGLRK